MFLHVSVILSTGGGVLWAGPPGSGRHPPSRENPPGTRQTPPAGRTPPDQADPPRRENPPLGPGRLTPHPHPPPAYGQWAAGTHPTGMYSCFEEFPFQFTRSRYNEDEPLIRLLLVTMTCRFDEWSSSQETYIVFMSHILLLDWNSCMRLSGMTFWNNKVFISYISSFQLLFHLLAEQFCSIIYF